MNLSSTQLHILGPSMPPFQFTFLPDRAHPIVLRRFFVWYLQMYWLIYALNYILYTNLSTSSLEVYWRTAVPCSLPCCYLLSDPYLPLVTNGILFPSIFPPERMFTKNIVSRSTSALFIYTNLPIAFPIYFSNFFSKKSRYPLR